VCNVAPIAGETKVWQYITLMKKVYLIDCPGVVPPGQETDEEKVMSSLIYVVVPSVLEIRDILVRIRIRLNSSVTLRMQFFLVTYLQHIIFSLINIIFAQILG
jgi:ribosome biogenesis GTPase A